MTTMRGVFERPKGSGVWWINYYDSDGRRHREKIGRENVAVNAYIKRQSEVRDGRFQAPRSGAKLKFRELAEDALANKKLRLAMRSWKTDKLRLAAVKEVFGETPASAISPGKIESFLTGLREKGRSTSTLNRYRSLMSSIFSFGVRSGKIRANPVAKVERFQENEHRVRFLSASEEEALRKAVRAISTEREAEMDLALHTGMRRGEQYGLTWADVDLERGIVTVQKGKTGRRFIVLNSVAKDALEILWEISNGSKFVCPDKRRDDQLDWRRWFEAATKTAKVDNFRWHDLRHTFASRLVMAGVDLSTVQKLLGHRSIVTTMRYAHLSPDHLQTAVGRLVTANWHQDGTRALQRRSKAQQVLQFQATGP